MLALTLHLLSYPYHHLIVEQWKASKNSRLKSLNILNHALPYFSLTCPIITLIEESNPIPEYYCQAKHNLLVYMIHRHVRQVNVSVKVVIAIKITICKATD